MPLDDTFNITRPGQSGATGNIDALHIEEYTGIVERTIDRKMALKPFVHVRNVKGASVFTNFGVGESALQKVTPGTPPDSTVTKFGKKTVQIDTTILARVAYPLLETWQTQYDARAETGEEHGKKLAKFMDQSFFIQALRAAKLTTSAYPGLVTTSGHFGGSQIVLTGANDFNDPAKMYAAIVDLIVKMQEKDVDPLTDDVIIACKPAMFGTLSQAELLINGQYLTSAGNSIQMAMLKHSGIPILMSNNSALGENITGNLLSNATNGNAYDGDFTKDVLVALSPRALMAGETIPVTTNVEWSQKDLAWLVDAYTAYAVGVNRPEFAGVISRP
jgi:hypothetical protein